jgi:hypothetical protein
MSQIITNWKGIAGTKHVHNLEEFDYDQDDILWLSDTISFETLDILKGMPCLPKFIVGDNASEILYDNDFKIYTTPFRGLECEFDKLKNSSFVNTIDTQYCFNFLINKKQINRHLLIKLVEYFQLDSFDYTWSGIGREFDMSQIIVEWQTDTNFQKFSKDLRVAVLSPIAMNQKFVNFQSQNIKSGGTIVNYGHNIWTWEYIFREMMTKTAVSLISESVAWQKSSVFTEKTLYAIMALTFPIYVGGYGHADQLKRMGFDTFDDIIDHSYQYKETLFERCYYAFLNNLELLSNLEFASTMRKQHLSRLKANQNKLHQGQIKIFIDNTVSSWPSSLQEAIQPLWNNIRSTLPVYSTK